MLSWMTIPRRDDAAGISPPKQHGPLKNPRQGGVWADGVVDEKGGERDAMRVLGARSGAGTGHSGYCLKCALPYVT